jgi:hypothetical protein
MQGSSRPARSTTQLDLTHVTFRSTIRTHPQNLGNTPASLSKSSKISATAIETPHVAPSLPEPVFRDKKHHIRIFQGDCLDILASLGEGVVDLIFADPPYFLSNNGITCHAGKMVSVN